MATRPGPATPRLMLGAQLRRLREAAGITPQEAAWRIRASRSKISRMETGRSGFKDRDVSELLELYGVTDPKVIAELRELASKAGAQAWWVGYADVLPGWYEPYLGLEAASVRIRTCDLQLVHGLFQTWDYAKTVTTVRLRHASRREITRRIEAQMQRQKLLDLADPPRVWSILDEAALRRPVGGPAVMREQLRHLLRLSQRPDITLQVVPFRAGLHDGTGGSFTHLRFAEQDVPDVVYTEQLTGAQYLNSPAHVGRYLGILNRLATTALTPAASADFLAALIRDPQSRAH